MKILIRNSDSAVIYAQDDLILDTEAHGDGWRDPNFNTTNATLVDAELPPVWSGAVWRYVYGVWVVGDQERYVELLNAKDAADIEAVRLQRAAAYPPLADKADAEVKMASSDPVMQAAGVLQLNEYVNKCLAVKLQFPKV